MDAIEYGNQLPLKPRASRASTSKLALFVKLMATVRSLSNSEQVLDSDRQLMDAAARCVEDGVRDRRRHANERNFAEPLHAERIHVWIHLVDEMNFELRDVEIHWQEILGHVRVDRPSISRIE